MPRRNTYEGEGRDNKKGEKKMTLEQFYTYQEQIFDSFIKKVIANEGKDARKEIARHAEHEISMTQLTEKEIAGLAIMDSYDFDKVTFHIKDDTVTINDILLGQAIAALPPRRREVILLSYFMGKNDPQIGELLNLHPNTIRYRRQTTLEKLKQILEGLEHGS